MFGHKIKTIAFISIFLYWFSVSPVLMENSMEGGACQSFPPRAWHSEGTQERGQLFLSLLCMN